MGMQKKSMKSSPNSSKKSGKAKKLNGGVTKSQSVSMKPGNGMLPMKEA